MDRVDAELKRVAPQIKMPGFRPGKVPTNLVKKMHGPAIEQDALNTSIQEGIQALIAEKQLRPAMQPSVELAEGYESGKDAELKVELEVLPQVPAPVIDALNAAFYTAFRAVEPTGRRLLLALDVSGSMAAGRVAGSSLTPREASAALALMTAATEANTHVVGFSAGPMTPLPLSPSMRLDDAVRAVSDLPFGATDCALPMLYALERGLSVDAFVVYTDSETWAGEVHPVQALRRYRERTGIAAKLVVVGLVSNGFSIADPDDAGMLDVVGFDTAAPAVIADFIRR